MKRARALLLAAILTACLTFVAFGDMGPKDSLTVTVVNPPTEAYYLDLLYLGQDGGELYDNLSQDRASLDQALLEKMTAARPEGYLLTMIDGTATPCWGDVVGTAASGGSRQHAFGYVGLPQTYRIQLVTASGRVYQSAAYTRRALQSGVTLDYATGEVAVPGVLGAYGLQFLSTCLPTLVIEGLLALAFGYSLKKYWRVLLLTNVATQVLLTAVLGTALITGGPTFVYILYLPLEMGIMAVEAVVYCRFFTAHSHKRAIGYAVAANAASYLTGALLAAGQFRLITSLLN